MACRVLLGCIGSPGHPIKALARLSWLVPVLYIEARRILQHVLEFFERIDDIVRLR